MTKCLLSLACLLAITVGLFAQTVTQRGVSYQYNGKQKRTPLGGVTIRPVSSSNAVLSDSAGTFTLQLQGLKMGSRIGTVSVKKRGMMVFNQQAVDEWSVRKDPLCLVLCDADEFDNQKQHLIEIGYRRAKQRYSSQKEALEQELAANKIKQQEYETALEAAYEELERARQHMAEYADLFARIDQSEIDTNAQEAMDLFNQGDVEGAIRRFEQGNYVEKLRQDNRDIQQAEQLKQRAEEAKAKAVEDRDRHVNSIKAQIEAYRLNNDWKKVGQTMKVLADEVGTYVDVYNYVSFCLKQNHLTEAETYVPKLLKLTDELPDKDTDTWRMQQVAALLSIAQINLSTNQTNESLSGMLEALKVSEQITDKNLGNVFVSICTPILASLYAETGSYLKSETAYLAAIKAWKKVDMSVVSQSLVNGLNLQQAEGNKTSMVTFCYTGLAFLYVKTKQFDKCEQLLSEGLKYLNSHTNDPVEGKLSQSLIWGAYYELYCAMARPADAERSIKESITIMRELANNNPRRFEGSLAGKLCDLGRLYLLTQQTQAAEAALKEAEAVYRTSVNKNSVAMRNSLSRVLCELGALYNNTQRNAEGEVVLQEALTIVRQLAKTNTTDYRLRLSDVTNTLGFLYLTMERYSESEPLFRESLAIREQLAKEDPLQYEGSLAQIFANLALLKGSQGQMDEALGYQEQAVNHYRKVAAKSPNAQAAFVEALWRYVMICSNTRQHAKAYEMSEELIPLLAKMVEMNPQQFKDDYAKVLGNQSYTCIFMKQYAKGERYARQALLLDESQHWIYTNLAAALLFQGKTEEAETICRQYKDELKEGILEDFKAYAEAGVIPKKYERDVERIKQMLNE
jgi:hypothetical protein